jgi:MFS family permease
MRFTSSRWPDVYLATGARAVSTAGDLLAGVALALAFEERGAGGYSISALLLATTVPMIVLGRYGGRLADRVDSRLLLVAVGSAQAACCAAMAFVEQPVALVGLVALLSAGVAVTQPTFGALLPAMVDRAALPKVMAISQTAMSLGLLAGPALAGVLVGAYGLRVPLLLDAASYLAIVAAGLAIRTRRNRRTTEHTASSLIAWRVRDDRLLALLVPATAVVIGAVSLVNVALVFFVRDTLAASATAYGLLEAVWAGTLLVGSWLVTMRVADDARLAAIMMGAVAGASAVFVAAAAVPGVTWLVPLWILGGACNGGLNTVGQLLVARRVPTAARGRALAAWVTAVNAAVTVGFFLGGPALSVLSPRQALGAAGGIGLIAAATFAVPVLRAAPHAPAPADSAERVAEPALVGPGTMAG